MATKRAPTTSAAAQLTAAPRASARGRAPGAVTQRLVWARSGGICAFPGCTTALYEDPVFATPHWLAEMAHNVGASVDGPRGDDKRSAELSDDPDNLLLFCPTHHTTVDGPGWRDHYPESVLRQWKTLHERAVKTAGQLAQGKALLPVQYIGTIAGQIPTTDASTIPRAALERGLVCVEAPTRLAIDASLYPAQSPAYWQHVAATVRSHLRLLQARASDQVPIGLFALAELPVLIALGFGVGHSAELHIFQWDRFAGSWAFPDATGPAAPLRVQWPAHWDGPIAIELSLSGTIEPERIATAMGSAAPSIVRITCDTPNVALVQSAATIAAFRTMVATAIAGIEAHAAKGSAIAVFPALPASLAVAFGAAIQPKANFLFCIHDAQGRTAPFHRALELPLPLTP